MNNTRVKPVILKSITVLDTETQLLVRDLRNSDSVRRWMYSDHIIGLNEHLGWIDRLRTDDKQIVFVALDEKGEVLGQAGITDIDRVHKKAVITIYMKENIMGVPPAVQVAVIDFAFDRLGMEKINCETIEGNNIVVSSVKKILFREEGFRRSQILKHGQRLGVHLLGVTREDWRQGRQYLQEKYKWMLTRFPVTIEWDENAREKPSIVDLIQEARSRNNINWMNLLRLAMDKSPDTAMELVDEIRKTDREINELTDRLFE